MERPVVRDPQIMGGTPCFSGTRVPFRVLIEYLGAGDTLEEFLEQFPTVDREVAIAALQEAGDALLERIQSEAPVG